MHSNLVRLWLRNVVKLPVMYMDFYRERKSAWEMGISRGLPCKSLLTHKLARLHTLNHEQWQKEEGKEKKSEAIVLGTRVVCVAEIKHNILPYTGSWGIKHIVRGYTRVYSLNTQVSGVIYTHYIEMARSYSHVLYSCITWLNAEHSEQVHTCPNVYNTWLCTSLKGLYSDYMRCA